MQPRCTGVVAKNLPVRAYSTKPAEGTLRISVATGTASFLVSACPGMGGRKKVTIN